MKKTFAILCAAAALFACSKVETAPIDEIQTPAEKVTNATPVSFNVTVNDMADTKVAKSAWADGDVIYIKFNGINDKYIYITYNGSTSSWDVTESATFTAADFDGKTLTLGAVYFPVAVDVSLVSNNLTFKRGGADVNTYYMSQSSADYTFDGTNVNVTLSLQKPSSVALFHIPGLQANAGDYALTVSGESTTTYLPYCSRINANGSLSMGVSGTGHDAAPGIPDADGAIFALALDSGFGTSKELTFTVTGPGVQEYSITGTKKLDAGKQYGLPALDNAKWTPKFKPFTVDSGKTVYIAPGNLMAMTIDGGEHWYWYFAGHQYDQPGGFTQYGSDNLKITTEGKSTATNCTIGLFGWSTDDNTFFGINKSQTATDWDGAFVDWGTLPIDPYAANTWRTPARSEIDYLLKTRTSSTVCGTANARYVRAVVNAVEGVILFPDDFTNPLATDLVNINIPDATPSNNTLSVDDWSALEKAGAVFLPAAGMILPHYGEYIDTYRGAYWTKSAGGTTGQIAYLLMQSSNVSANYSSEKNNRMSVRLVYDVL